MNGKVFVCYICDYCILYPLTTIKWHFTPCSDAFWIISSPVNTGIRISVITISGDSDKIFSYAVCPSVTSPIQVSPSRSHCINRFTSCPTFTSSSAINTFRILFMLLTSVCTILYQLLVIQKEPGSFPPRLCVFLYCTLNVYIVLLCKLSEFSNAFRVTFTSVPSPCKYKSQC